MDRQKRPATGAPVLRLRIEAAMAADGSYWSSSAFRGDAELVQGMRLILLASAELGAAANALLAASGTTEVIEESGSIAPENASRGAPDVRH